MVEDNFELSDDDIERIDRMSQSVPEWLDERLGLLFERNYIQDWYSFEHSWDEYVRLKYRQYLYRRMVQHKSKD